MRAILTFHSIDDSGSVLSFPPGGLVALLGGLDRAGIPVLALDDLLAAGAGPGVALTFDDGLASVRDAALPVLRERKIPAHVFLVTSVIGGRNHRRARPTRFPAFATLGWEAIEELHASGVQVESHTADHPDLTELSAAAIQDQCAAADAAISARLGRAPRYFAYPYGRYDARVRNVVARRYRAALTDELRTLRSREDPFALPRIDAYYLRPHWVLRRPNAWATRGYLSFRGVLRGVRRSAAAWSASRSAGSGGTR